MIEGLLCVDALSTSVDHLILNRSVLGPKVLPRFWPSKEPLSQVTRGAAKTHNSIQCSVRIARIPVLFRPHSSATQAMRSPTRCLVARAMNHFGNDRQKSFIQDLIKVRQKGDLSSQNGLLVDCLVGCVLIHMAILAEMTVLESADLTWEEIDDNLQ